MITNQLLYQLSYTGLRCGWPPGRQTEIVASGAVRWQTMWVERRFGQFE
jgi:hypothetical protein